MTFLHTGTGIPGAVLSAAIAVFVILAAAVLAATALIAIHARNPAAAPKACRPRPRTGAGRQDPSAPAETSANPHRPAGHWKEPP